MFEALVAQRSRTDEWKGAGMYLVLDRFAARSTDVILSAAAIVALMPVLILVAILVFVADPGPVFYAQRRIGRGGREFSCFKFRSMATDSDARLKALLHASSEARAEWERDHKLRNDPRIVGIGRLLRKSSLDELPQLFNVLRGDMSLVGPRPIVSAEVARYGRYFEEYCRVRPGITGLWQISGRNEVSYRRRVAMDVIYVRSRCFRLNWKILIYTLPSVLLVRGAY